MPFWGKALFKRPREPERRFLKADLFKVGKKPVSTGTYGAKLVRCHVVGVGRHLGGADPTNRGKALLRGEILAAVAREVH